MSKKIEMQLKKFYLCGKSFRFNINKKDRATIMPVLFFILGIVMTIIALHPKWRRKWYWGRGKDRVPISSFGMFTWITTFFTISAVGAKHIHPLWIACSVTMIFAAAIWDSLHATQKTTPKWLKIAAWICFVCLVLIALLFAGQLIFFD